MRERQELYIKDNAELHRAEELYRRMTSQHGTEGSRSGR